MNTISKTYLFIIDESHWTLIHAPDVIHTKFFLQHKSLLPKQWWFLALYLSNCRSTLTHSQFNTNIILFPHWKPWTWRSISCWYSIHLLSILRCILYAFLKYQVVVVNVLANLLLNHFFTLTTTWEMRSQFRWVIIVLGSR